MHTRREGGAIATANADNSFVNTGIAGSFTTKASSSTSDMVFNLYSGMMHCQSSVKGETAICLTTSSNTTYSNTNNLLGGCQYQNYIGTSNEYQPTSIVLYNHFITYSAGDTLYWRLFMKKNTTDGNNFYVFHAGSTLYITMREILK